MIAVITGASKGIGKALAAEYVRRAATVIASGRYKDTLEAAAAEVGALPFVADVTKDDDIEALAAFALQHGPIDVWINNAGVWLPHKPGSELDIERVRVMYDTNVLGVMRGTKTALVEMAKIGKGTIVNISSTAGLVGRPTSSGYSSSKWAVRGYSDSIRAECEGSGIRIVAVYPGGTKTHLFDEKLPKDFENFMTPESVAEKIIDNLESATPEMELVIKRPHQPDGPKG
ncbi:MAG: SDR family oxidoreductase [Patescibacteria group bacterium]